MSQEMENKQTETSGQNEQNGRGGKCAGRGGCGGKRRGGKRFIGAALFLIAVSSVVVMGVTRANEGGCFHGGHGMGMQSMMDPAAQEKHLDAMLQHVLPDGTPEQKAKLREIAKSAMNDLRPLQAQHKAIHQDTVKLLTANTIDRPALEQERQQIMHLGDQASLRITKAVEDAAEVLTPDQRVKLAEQLQKHMG